MTTTATTATTVTTAKKPSVKVALKCNECGKTFRVSPNVADPSCPKCGGADWDVK